MSRLAFAALSAVGLVACGAPPGPSGGGVPPDAMPVSAISSRDPVGFLLQFRDSIGINDTVALELVRLNLRLFRRRRLVEIQLDSLMRGVRLEQPAQRGDSTGGLPPDVLQRARPLQQQMRDQTAAVRDTAWAMLTEDQRNVATALELRLQEMMRRRAGQSPGPGTQQRP